MVCDRSDRCAFYVEFSRASARPEYQFLVKSYCHGTLQETCRRRAYERNHGEPAPANLCPNGFRCSSPAKGPATSGTVPGRGHSSPPKHSR